MGKYTFNKKQLLVLFFMVFVFITIGGIAIYDFKTFEFISCIIMAFCFLSLLIALFIFTAASIINDFKD